MSVVTPPVHDYVPDRIIWPVLDQLAVCLCEELIRSALPPTCFCGVVAGEPAFDITEDDRGYAWVRLVAVSPTTDFPAPTITSRNCASMLMAQFEVGVMRCFPGALTGEMPTTTEQWEAVRLQQADMAAMYRAIQCCAKKYAEFTLGAYTPVGPDGGYVGGNWTVYALGAGY